MGMGDPGRAFLECGISLGSAFLGCLEGKGVALGQAFSCDLDGEQWSKGSRSGVSCGGELHHFLDC